MSSLYIKWSQENELGIPIIDEQHRAAVATINSLFYFIQKKRGIAALRPTLSVLEQYTKIHFETEEELLKQSGYPDFEAHANLHRELESKSHEIMRQAIADEDASMALTFLKEWWLDHINKQDRKYLPYLK
jgi:hemerythrin